MAHNRPYHEKVLSYAGKGMNVGIGIGLIYTLVTVATAPVAAPGFAGLLAAYMAPALMNAVAGAVLGAVGAMAYGAVRHSPLFSPPDPEHEVGRDRKALQAMISNSLAAPDNVPALHGRSHAARLRPRAAGSFVEAERERQQALMQPFER